MLMGPFSNGSLLIWQNIFSLLRLAILCPIYKNCCLACSGSVLGPLLLSLYTSPLSTLIGKHKGINFHSYANNTQLYVHLSHMNASAAFDKLNRCLQDVKEWMSASKLKLNPDKTEFILFSSKKQRKREVKSMFPNRHLG